MSAPRPPDDAAGIARCVNVEVPTPDGAMTLFEVVPTEAVGAVIVGHEGFGATPHIEGVARRFAEAGYHAVVPHLFHRSGDPVLAYGEAAAIASRVPLDVVDAMRALRDSSVLADIDATLEHLQLADWSDRQIAIVGFCLGGRVAFLAALRRKLGAAVGLYGGGIVTARFEEWPTLVDDVATLQTPWLGIYGDRDHAVPIEEVREFESALAEAPCPSTTVVYEGAEHGFFCDERAAYKRDAAEDAWRQTLAWLERYVARGD